MPKLCKADGVEAARWMNAPSQERLTAAFLMILLGGGFYGFALGYWRAPEMGFYVAVKLPILLLLVCLCNGLLNGMLAMVMGSGLGLRQTLMAMLMSFSIFSMIVGSLGPITLALAFSLTGPETSGAESAYSLLLLLNVIVIVFAGVLSHRRFFPGLAAATSDRGLATKVFLAWLLGNLFVGAQLSWNLRPFFGQPGNPAVFLRSSWNEGNFYETLGLHSKTLWNSLFD